MLLEGLVIVFISFVSILLCAYSFRQCYLAINNAWTSEDCLPAIVGRYGCAAINSDQRFGPVVLKRGGVGGDDVLAREYKVLCCLFARASTPLTIMAVLTGILRAQLAHKFGVFQERFSAAAANGCEQISLMTLYFICEIGNRAPPLRLAF